MIMVMLARNLAFSPEFEKARADLQTARKNYAVLVEEYSLLTGVVSKNLEAEYMLKLGKKEYELFSCQVEVLRLKREISLFQAARNRGEIITEEEVAKIIKEEFSEYQQLLEKQKANLEFARMYIGAEKLSPEEIKELKKLYHDIVRKLHPDLNPDLPDEAAVLWERVQAAYQMNEWQELYLLAEMVEELLEGKKDPVEAINSLVQMQEETAKILQKTSELETQIAKTKERVPFVYEKLLRDPAAIKVKRHELDWQIKLCKNRLKELKELRIEFGA
jgi:hypothetical protein